MLVLKQNLVWCHWFVYFYKFLIILSILQVSRDRKTEQPPESFQ